MAIKTYYFTQGNKPTIDKDPAERDFYSIDFGKYLRRQGLTISAASAQVAEGLTLHSTDYDDYTITVELSGGTLGAPLYEVRYAITKSNGKNAVRRVYIRILPG